MDTTHIQSITSSTARDPEKFDKDKDKWDFEDVSTSTGYVMGL